MSGHDMFRLVEDVLEGTRTFESGFPVNLEGYWTPEILLLGTASVAAANYVAFTPCPYTTAVLEQVQVIYGTASTSGTLQLERLQGTEAPGNGDTLLASTVDLSATANTVYAGTLTTGSSLTFSKGDRIGLIDGGTLTNLFNLQVTARFKITQF